MSRCHNGLRRCVAYSLVGLAADFSVQRVAAGQPTTVQVTINDGCGGWTTFVGGGTHAGF